MWLVLLNLVPVMIWMERKGAAYVQDRVGPNRAHVFGIRLAGMIHNVADAIKLLTKEDVIPGRVSKPYYLAAPFIAMAVALLTYAVIPFADTIPTGVVGDRAIPMQAADLNVGVLYILAVSSLAVYAVVLAGWASNNKYGLLGGLRSSAQMISYEVSIGLSIIGVVMAFGSVRLNDIVCGQGGLLAGAVPKWGILIQPLGFILYVTCAFAETNRNPFDLPEGESEIVAGYHIAYSSMKFALFFMAEYCNILVQAAIIASLFLGGWQIPWLPTAELRSHIGTVVPVVCGGSAAGLLVLALLFQRYHTTNRYAWPDARKREGAVLSAFSLAGSAILAALCTVTVFVWSPAGSEAAAAVLAAVIQFGVFLAKTLLVAWCFVWVRWTLPRFRYDQLMRLGWQVLLPLSLVNVLVTGLFILFSGS
jgi:NADH-quinone oxidoreductase subunit H